MIDRVEQQVALLGASLGTGNRGVSALGASLVKLICEAEPGIQPVMVIGSRTASPFQMVLEGKPMRVGVVNFRMSPRAGFKEHVLSWFFLSILYRIVPFRSFRKFLEDRHPLIRISACARLVADIRGGDSFSDIYGLNNFILGSLPIISALLVRGTIVLLPQTYGPYKSVLARKIARYILMRASTILSRDGEGLAVVERLIGRTRTCQSSPDVAFALEPRRPPRLDVQPPLNSASKSRLIGLNVNGLMYRGGYTRKNMFGLKLDYPAYLLSVIRGLLQEGSEEVLLVPHTFAPPDRIESDPQACREVRQQLSVEEQARVHLLEGEYDQNEIKSIIGLCDFFIGSRMHACIAALSQGIPTVGVAYSRKFKGVFETVGASDFVIDGRDFSAGEAVSRTLELYRGREAIRPTLMESAEQARARLKAVFARLMDGTRPYAKNEATAILTEK